MENISKDNRSQMFSSVKESIPLMVLVLVSLLAIKEYGNFVKIQEGPLIVQASTNYCSDTNQSYLSSQEENPEPGMFISCAGFLE